jgi:hypothetical protein
MPGFGASMTDAQVAGLVNFLSEATTGKPVDVSADAVAEARAEKGPIVNPLEE